MASGNPAGAATHGRPPLLVAVGVLPEFTVHLVWRARPCHTPVCPLHELRGPARTISPSLNHLLLRQSTGHPLPLTNTSAWTSLDLWDWISQFPGFSLLFSKLFHVYFLSTFGAQAAALQNAGEGTLGRACASLSGQGAP